MSDILESLFGSKTKVRVIRFLLLNPEGEYLMEEIAEKNKLNKSEVRKDINLLNKIRFVSSKIRKKKKYYKLDKNFPFYEDLERLMLCSNTLPQGNRLKKIRLVGNVKLLLVSGVFLNNQKSRVDLLMVVDNASKAKLKSAISHLEAEIGKEIRYMVLTSDEFNYRLNMLDRFLMDFFKAPHEVIINKIPKFKNIVANIKR